MHHRYCPCFGVSKATQFGMHAKVVITEFGICNAKTYIMASYTYTKVETTTHFSD